MTSGTYTVQGTFTTSPFCSSVMNGSVSINANAIPTIFNLTTGNNSYCLGSTGDTLTLSGSQLNVYYQLYKNGSAQGSAVDGTGNPLTWNTVLFGTYTIVATSYDPPYCTSNMSGSVVITQSPAPTVYNLTGSGNYCSSGSGLSVTLANSQLGINYQLKKNSVNQGTAISGTGAALVWSNQTVGNYTVVATYVASPYCSANMNGTVVITTSPSPTIFNLTGGGSYCTGSTGLNDTLSGSQIGVNYQLKKNGVNQGGVVSGSGSIIVWTNLTGGTYTVVATYVASPYCTATMNGSVIITENANPTAFNLTGGGAYCIGGTGLSDTLSGSQVGINYQLKKNSVNQGSVVAGTGSALVWNNLTFGTYTVVAAYATAPYCSTSMNGSVIITENPLPNTFNFTGGGTYCAGGLGLNDTLNGSQVGVIYQLKKNGITQGSVVSGTGSSLVWNNLAFGTYTVVATYATAPYCTANMNGSVIITESPLPTTFSLTGGNTYCTGSSGSSDTLSGSQVGVNYQLKKNGVDQGSAVSGTGSALIWNNLTNGTYTVVATYAATPYCAATMNGSVVITESPLPNVFNITGGGTYCAGSAGLCVTLSGSQSGIGYQLKKNSTNEGSAVSGTGGALA